ncbi:hypothetical protein BLOT_000062 [Blomia tropicalis]|nr:hypothetical protein BLOT_000062 [Blomia tropicalis]
MHIHQYVHFEPIWCSRFDLVRSDESLSYSSSISHNSKDSTNLFSSRYDWSSSIPFGMGSSFLKQCKRWSSDPSKFVNYTAIKVSS